jgi:hypothetical protein
MWFLAVVEVYWALALVEQFEGLLRGMLFVVGRMVGDGRLSGIGLACVWGVIVWRMVSVVIGLVFEMGVRVLV